MKKIILAAGMLVGALSFSNTAFAEHQYSPRTFCASAVELNHGIKNICGRPLEFFWCTSSSQCDGYHSTNNQWTIDPGDTYPSTPVNGVVFACEKGDSYRAPYCIGD